MERIYNGGTNWPLTITDETISQMLPCRFSDFVAGVQVPTHGRQRIFTENMLLTHPFLTTDSWTLYIKATILVSRVRSFNFHYRIPTAPTGTATSEPDTERATVSPTESEQFRQLNQTITAFVRDMPRAYRNPVGTAVDPLLYMAHLLPHVAMIQLHDPHAQLHSPNDHSAMQLLAATRAIMDLIYKLCGTTYDLLYLDHGCSFCWFVAGAALIRFLKAKMDAGDEDEVARIEQELGAVKFMLKNLGDRTGIGQMASLTYEPPLRIPPSTYGGLCLTSDGSLPCESCRRAHAYEVKTRPATAAAEPTCEYDHPDVVAEGPKGRIARLEEQIAELQALLEAANQKLALCSCGASSNGLTFFSQSGGTSASPSDNIQTISSLPVSNLSQEDSPADAGHLTDAIRVALSVSDTITSAPPPIDAFLLAPSPWNLSAPPSLPALLPDSASVLADGIDAATFDICPSSWPLNIPPPMVLYHLVDVFFDSVPLADRLIHKPTFMVGLRQVPTSPEFPHVALLHAICGLASLYSPVISDPKEDVLSQPPDFPSKSSAFYPILVLRPNAKEGIQRKHYFPKSLEDIIDLGEEGFGAAHIRWAAASLRLAVLQGDRLLQLVQAAIWSIVKAYTWIGSVTRLVGPLGFHASEGFEPLSRMPSTVLFLCGTPRNHVEAETIRNAFWITYVMERIYNAGTCWPLTINDEEITQMMPCRFSDFVAGERVPTHGRQRLFTENMLLTHPPLTTDSWTLYIKAIILVSRVRSFNCRYRVPTVTRSGRSSEASRGMNGERLSPTETDDFQLLDQTIVAFVREMPRAYRDPVGSTVDPLLYMAHLLPHVAMIQLHDPHAQPESPNDYSAMQMLAATRAIMDLIYKICGTTYDLLYLDHGCSFCWFVAGAAVIRFLKAKMDAGDEDEVAKLEQELGVVKFMLKNLGDRAVLGIRQLRLLDEIYNVEVKGWGRHSAKSTREGPGFTAPEKGDILEFAAVSATGCVVYPPPNVPEPKRLVNPRSQCQEKEAQT
ncbi:hypothetical protein FS837_002180 [Tulasnella sp. UAMH 9824]|nr:hypothetical protein FS837_002180 [Tulasnella sp. UAMH 9824]